MVLLWARSFPMDPSNKYMLKVIIETMNEFTEYVQNEHWDDIVETQSYARDYHQKLGAF